MTHQHGGGRGREDDCQWRQTAALERIARESEGIHDTLQLIARRLMVGLSPAETAQLTAAANDLKAARLALDAAIDAQGTPTDPQP
jgi:hypothetical protein